MSVAVKWKRVREEGLGGNSRAQTHTEEACGMRRLIYVALLASCLGCVGGICVIDNKWGWSLECGIRDSYLFRIKDYGGVRANFDFGFGIGNEKGFPYSITNTKKAAHYKRKDYTSRSSDVTLEGTEGVVTRQSDQPRVRTWLPLRLRPPPVNVQPPAGNSQFPAQSRKSVGHVSLEKTSIGSQHRETEVENHLNPGQGVPVVYSAERGTVQSSPESISPVAIVAAEGRTPVAIVSAERESPFRVVSVERGSPVSLPSFERNLQIRQGQTQPQRRPFPWRGQNHRNRNVQQPTIAQSLLSWLPWPFNYWTTTPAPTPAFDAAPVRVSGPAPSRVAGGSQAVGSFDRATSNFKVIHEGNSGQFSLPTGNAIPANQGNQFQLPAQFVAPPQQIHQLSHQPSHQPQHHAPTTSPLPTVGPEIAEVLKVNADTPADTDHVPSFAARMFVVRQAPQDFHPPGYTPDPEELKTDRVEVPRTNFFCEEHKYLPGIYADTQLGCKVFHLCVPAAMGNTLTSFICPNMTLFDQSVLQCNWWYHVHCEDSHKHYDANLPMAIGYRRINAAQIPLSAVNNLNSVSLLEHNAESFGSRISRALELGSVEFDVNVNNIEKEDLNVNSAEDDSTESHSGIHSPGHEISTENSEQVSQNSSSESVLLSSSDKPVQQNLVNETGNFGQKFSNEAEHLHQNSQDEARQYHQIPSDGSELPKDIPIGLPKSSPSQDTSAVMKRFFSLLEATNTN